MMEELTFSCPVCGADVPRKAKACPECGACDKSGWSEDHYLDGVDLPDDPAALPARSGSGSGRQRLWQIVAAIVLLAFLLLMLSGRW
jgi:hypothetical protein